MQQEDYYKILQGIVIALMGGIVSYMVTNKPHNIKDAFIKGISSGFVGLLIGLLTLYANLPEPLVFFLCGTFGYLGSEVTIALLKKWVEARITQIK